MLGVAGGIEPGVGEDEAFGFDDLAEDAAGPFGVAGGGQLFDAPGAAGAEIDLAGGSDEAARTAPALDALRLDPGFEDEVRGASKCAR